MRVTTRAALLSIILASTFIPHVSSASCLYQTPEELLASADIVVEAEVTDVVASPESTTVVANVQEVIKGEVGDTVSFITGSGTQVITSVDVFFEEGATYKLYLLRNEQGLLTTTSCAGTHQLAATSGPSELPPTQPTDDVNDTPPQSATPWIISGIILAATLVAMGSVMMRHRKA